MGEPIPTVEWFFNGIPIQPSPRIQIIVDDNISTLIIFNVVPEDSGEYTCSVENEMGAITCKTSLHITRK